jgi:hypothetical protein
VRHPSAREARNHLIGKRISRECHAGARFWQKRGPIAVAIAQTFLAPREFRFRPCGIGLRTPFGRGHAICVGKMWSVLLLQQMRPAR